VSDLTSLLDEYEAPYQDVPICLKKNLLDERDQAMAAIPGARNGVQDARMAMPGVAAATKRVEEIEERIKAASITLRITGVDRHTYNAWLLACPPRKGVDAGAFNPTKFFMHAAMNSAVYVDKQGVEHEITAEQWATIDKKISDGEHDRIAQAVIHVNRTVGSVDVTPFVTASETTRDSFGISASRETSGSRRAVSGAGSRQKSTSKKSTGRGAASSE
jgi:hypothetical protein